MHDVFARVGGPDLTEVKASTMVQINSGNVIIDDTWLWRADHDVSGKVMDKKNPVDTGLQVNGDNVIGYGLAVEHTLGNLLEWNGDNGKTYFYQSELPYDVDHTYEDSGFTSYIVGDDVINHEAWGVGVYSFFRDFTVNMDSGIKVPKQSSVKFHNSLSVFLTGNGGINHVVND
jgi:predicted heme/steroid binding protein